MAVLAIHDLSCYSKSSLTVVIPVMEALGVETAVLPVSVLSTQTDGFDDVAAVDNTEGMERILAAFSHLGIAFDGVYTGYLGDNRRVDIALKAIESSGHPVLVDPVMGDDGELYPSLSEDLPSHMLRLVKKADIITPNLTEAMMLTGLDDGIRKLGQRDIKDLIDVLRSFGPRQGVITSIPLVAGGLGNAAWDGNEIRLFSYDDLGSSFPGAGDLFASVLYALTIRGDSFFGSALHAQEIASYAVQASLRNGRERRLGIELYPALREISRRML